MGFRDFPEGSSDVSMERSLRRRLTEAQKNKIDPTREARMKIGQAQELDQLDFGTGMISSFEAGQEAENVNIGQQILRDALNIADPVSDEFNMLVHQAQQQEPDELDKGMIEEDTIQFAIDDKTPKVGPRTPETDAADDIKSQAIMDRVAANIARATGSYAPRADAMLVDRLRAFRERRRGLTPSNQFTKMQLEQDKLDQETFSLSGSKKGFQRVKLLDGTIGLFDPTTGSFYDSKGNEVQDPRFHRETAEAVARKTLARERVKDLFGKNLRLTQDKKSGETVIWDAKNQKVLGVMNADESFLKGLNANQMKELNKERISFNSRYRNAFNDLATASKSLNAMKVGGVLGNKIGVMGLIKTIEQRMSDLDRAFYTGNESRFVQFKDFIVKQQSNELPERLIRQARNILKSSIDHGLELIRSGAKRTAGQLNAGMEIPIEKTMKTLFVDDEAIRLSGQTADLDQIKSSGQELLDEILGD